MNARTFALVLSLLPVAAAAQGFAGLGSAADGYAFPDPDYRFTFPEDHGPHNDFRIEWWYVTANLTGEDGQAYGIQWTLFRNALAPSGADSEQAWMGHAAISAPDGHRHAERLARGSTGQAGVTANPFAAFIDEWHMEGSSLSVINLTAQGPDFAYDLRLETDKPFIAQGENGYSIKSEAGQASHYYSQPFYRVEGTLIFSDREIDVVGQGWLDREWSSAPLAENQTGWDWISLHLESGDKLMGYRLRDDTGEAYTVGTWISAEGEATPLRPGDLTMIAQGTSRVAGRDIPIDWQVVLPSRELDVRVRARYRDSWMPTLVPYWEGPVSVIGSHSGQGYLEMSGYE